MSGGGEKVERVQVVTLYGAARSCVQIEDGWEGMDLCAVAFGEMEDGKPTYPSGEHAMDWDMARALGHELIRFADLHSPLPPAPETAEGRDHG